MTRISKIEKTQDKLSVNLFIKKTHTRTARNVKVNIQGQRQISKIEKTGMTKIPTKFRKSKCRNKQSGGRTETYREAIMSSNSIFRKNLTTSKIRFLKYSHFSAAGQIHVQKFITRSAFLYKNADLGRGTNFPYNPFKDMKN